MIAGIGTDIVEVDRVASKLQKGDDFLKHVFRKKKSLIAPGKKFLQFIMRRVGR
ncbi:MAG: hypothetical protein IPN26_00495 [Bacteroidetes bacterium]|nr:hypothetical protein [Bacteroidota bacterium]